MKSFLHYLMANFLYTQISFELNKKKTAIIATFNKICKSNLQKKNRFNRMICNFVFNIALLSLNVHVKAKAIAFETHKKHI